MKFRKLLSFVLAIALLAVPALSLGEGAASAAFLDQAYAAGRNVKTTVTFTPGSIFATDPNLSLAADLLKVLKIETFSEPDFPYEKRRISYSEQLTGRQSSLLHNGRVL